jgi:uncharacterized membrane protein YccF (DUF307 family)
MDHEMDRSTVIATSKNPGCLFQLLWFAFVGWWLGQAWMVVAWILMISIIGIPFGIMMLNILPKVIALRDPAEHRLVVTRHNGSVTAREVDVPQANIFLRAIYFLLVGWWLSAFWMEAAFVISLTIIGLPIGFWMFDRVPLLVSLKR